MEYYKVDGETDYKPGDFRRATEKVHNYAPKSKREVKFPDEGDVLGTSNEPEVSIGTTKILDELIEELGEESPIRKSLLDTRDYTMRVSR